MEEIAIYFKRPHTDSLKRTRARTRSQEWKGSDSNYAFALSFGPVHSTTISAFLTEKSEGYNFFFWFSDERPSTSAKYYCITGGLVCIKPSVEDILQLCEGKKTPKIRTCNVWLPSVYDYRGKCTHREHTDSLTESALTLCDPLGFRFVFYNQFWLYLWKVWQGVKLGLNRCTEPLWLFLWEFPFPACEQRRLSRLVPLGMCVPQTIPRLFSDHLQK